MWRRGAWGILRVAGRVQRMLAGGRIVGVVERRVSLDEAKEGLRNYVEHMTAGKVVISPHGRAGGATETAELWRGKRPTAVDLFSSCLSAVAC